MKLMHGIGAVLGGLLAGGVVVMAIQGISSLIYRMPPDLDPNDLQAVSDWIHSLPVGAFLLVLASEACGYFVGTFVARRLAPERRATPGLIVWGFLLVAAIANLVMIPHPPWFAIASVVSWMVFGLSGLRVAAPAKSDCGQTQPQ